MAFGPLPGPQQTAVRAELYAVIQVLKHGILPMHIKTDCLGLVEALDYGQRHCTHSRRENSDLWRQFWHAIDGIGGFSDDLQITWVPGHQTGVTVGESGPAYLDKVGNDYADVAAKKGTLLHRFPEEAYDEHKRLLSEVRQTAAWIGNSQADVEELADRRPAESRRTRGALASQRRVAAAASATRAAQQRAVTEKPLAHSPFLDPSLGQWRRRHCPRFARSRAGLARLLKERCPAKNTFFRPPPWGRFLRETALGRPGGPGQVLQADVPWGRGPNGATSPGDRRAQCGSQRKRRNWSSAPPGGRRRRRR